MADTITLDGYCWSCKVPTPHLIWLEPEYDNKCTVCQARHYYATDDEQDCIDTFNDCETCDHHYWSQQHQDNCDGVNCPCEEDRLDNEEMTHGN